MALAAVCPGAFAPAAGTSLAELIAMEYAGLGRPPSTEEAKTWSRYLSEQTVRGCDASAGACDLGQLATDLCMSLFATTQFNYY
jgi:hypothetical protein